MLKEVFASNAAKLVAACVCPVVATSAIVMKVPQVREAVHRATAPKARPQPHREARAMPRVRKPAEFARTDAPDLPLASPMMCTRPAAFEDAALARTVPLPLTTVQIETRTENVYTPTNCPSIGGGVISRTTLTAVPEPATWAQMIAGFALLGGTLRVGNRRALRRV